MPEKETMEKARRAKREGKAATTQAGEFIREEMEHIREGKHGARSTKQAIAIGLSKARRAGVKLPPPKKGQTTERTRRSAERAYREGQSGHHKKANPRRSKAIKKALLREGHESASHAALARQAKTQAHRRTAKERSESTARQLEPGKRPACGRDIPDAGKAQFQPDRTKKRTRAKEEGARKKVGSLPTSRPSQSRRMRNVGTNCGDLP